MTSKASKIPTEKWAFDNQKWSNIDIDRFIDFVEFIVDAEHIVRTEKIGIFPNQTIALCRSIRFKNIRKSMLSIQSSCKNCGATGPLCIDHILPSKRFPWLFWDENNLQVLCYTCNIKKGGSFPPSLRREAVYFEKVYHTNVASIAVSNDSNTLACIPPRKR